MGPTRIHIMLACQSRNSYAVGPPLSLGQRSYMSFQQGNVVGGISYGPLAWALAFASELFCICYVMGIWIGIQKGGALRI